ncbi:MAG: PLP-dependent aminotransferase family protein [Deltaproteobacteria bacterium]|nr:PLP-dependent aminotransferase family protein [Deltaproteobacteria bacterium]
MSTASSSQKVIPAGMIDLGIGQPSPWLLPAAAMQKAAGHCAKDPGCVLLAYGVEQGDGHFRLALSGFLEGIYGMPVEPAHLLVTNGASQAIDLICTLFSKAGDTIFVEEPTYFLARKIFADHQLEPVALPMDEDGLIVDAVEGELKRSRPAFLYSIPTYHNPTSACLSGARRKQLVELCRRYELLVVADEVYHPLSYTSVPPPPLAAFCTSAPVISLGSFSKILAPGLRLGWLQAAPEVIERIVRCGLLDSGGGLNPFTSGVVRSALELGLVDKNLALLKDTYSRRMQAMCAALRSQTPESIRFSEPSGGFFIWLSLPEGRDALAILSKAKERNIEFMPGSKFSSRHGLKNFLRLSFAYYDTPDLLKGIERLVAVIGEC